MFHKFLHHFQNFSVNRYWVSPAHHDNLPRNRHHGRQRRQLRTKMFHLPSLAQLQVYQTTSVRRKMAGKHRLELHFCDSMRSKVVGRFRYSDNHFEVHVL